MEFGAVVSDDGLYRYELTRGWGSARGRICWVMLNPSTADAAVDDPTIRRCIRFSRDACFGSLVVVNLFAYRATSPAALIDAAEAGISVAGPENFGYIKRNIVASQAVVQAWGAGFAKIGLPRPNIKQLVPDGTPLYDLGRTKGDHPRHPLYVPAREYVRLVR